MNDEPLPFKKGDKVRVRSKFDPDKVSDEVYEITCIYLRRDTYTPGAMTRPLASELDRWECGLANPLSLRSLRSASMGRLLQVSVIDRLAEIGQFLPTKRDIGRSVVYTPHEGAKAEDGVITSLNDDYVHVRYAGGNGSKATRREDLRWLAG